MEVIKRAIKPESYISFLHIYPTTWGTAGDICLIRESVANNSTGAKFVGHFQKGWSAIAWQALR